MFIGGTRLRFQTPDASEKMDSFGDPSKLASGSVLPIATAIKILCCGRNRNGTRTPEPEKGQQDKITILAMVQVVLR